MGRLLHALRLRPEERVIAGDILSVLAMVCAAVLAACIVSGCNSPEPAKPEATAPSVAPAGPVVPKPVPAAAATVRGIPRAALQYRAELTRNARSIWGLDAPVATMAAQIHQESGWRTDAKSPVGAQGMAQFMPATASWIADLVPELAACEPYNPAWAIRALVTYDKWLWDRLDAASDCHRMAFALAAYNGGLGWVRRDAKMAAGQGLSPEAWWDHVETVNAGRSAANWRENRGYPRRILLALEPLYLQAGFGGGACRD
ncbi:Phage lysin [Desulfovibrio sp. DV]|uniref:transglycosylase SLT domain-containing protein n=1 Tax=Desulfovibrio sp. DV TaxID=1844708 RepID=UPI0009682DC5|nr:Phage lysin [Desulfovibrio sp. DV]